MGTIRDLGIARARGARLCARIVPGSVARHGHAGPPGAVHPDDSRTGVPHGPVTRDRILGAVAAYLLFGLTWASAYHLLAIHLPGLFRSPPDRADPWPTWAYFSFVTLTTVGYGDVTPVAMPAARWPSWRP